MSDYSLLDLAAIDASESVLHGLVDSMGYNPLRTTPTCGGGCSASCYECDVFCDFCDV